MTSCTSEAEQAPILLLPKANGLMLTLACGLTARSRDAVMDASSIDIKKPISGFPLGLRAKACNAVSAGQSWAGWRPPAPAARSSTSSGPPCQWPAATLRSATRGWPSIGGWWRASASEHGAASHLSEPELSTLLDDGTAS